VQQAFQWYVHSCLTHMSGAARLGWTAPDMPYRHTKRETCVKRNLRPTRLLAALLALGLIAAACSSSSTTATTATTQVNVPQGGSLVIGAEQEPDCLDWIATCGASSWGYWMANVTTMPRAYDPVKDGDQYGYVPGVLLTGEADLKTDPTQVVTYHINPKAVWSDGQPITSADFKYTWEQIATGTDIYDKTGYSDISAVDATDPATAVVTFSTPFASWKSLFGGGYGVLPSHILSAVPDRDAAMKDGYKWSGGPYLIDSWNKTESITLVPNPKWYGPTQSHLDKVIFKFVADTSAEFQAFKGGEVKMIYPQPQLDVVDQINAGLADTNSTFNAETGSYEAIWMNNAAAPVDDVKVRQAIGYSIDRDAIVNKLFGQLGVTTALQVMNAPIVNAYSDTQAFAGYKPDLAKVDELLTSDGYAKGSDGIYAKGGKPLTITVTSTAGNKRRELTEQVMQQQLKDAGIGMTIANQKAGDFFGQVLPAGTYMVGIYAQQLTSIDPGRCGQMCSKNIPTDANGSTGNNVSRINVPELDPLLAAVDNTLDNQVRTDKNKQADGVTADQLVSLPLDPLPDIVLWNKSVVGPVGDNAVLGPWWNLQDWGVTP